MNSISKNSTITFLSQILTFILGFVTSIILARTLGPKGKGIYALIILIPTLMLKLGSLGIENANVYFTGSKKYKIDDIVSNSLLSSILLGSILFLLFFTIYPLAIFQNFLKSNQLNDIYLCLAVLAVPFLLFSGFLESILLGKEKIIIFNKINILKTVFNLMVIIILLFIFKQGVFGVIIAYLLTSIFFTLLVILFIIKYTKINISYNRKLFKDIISYGIKAYFSNLITFLNYRLDMLLVAIFLGPIEVGYYSMAVMIVEKIWMLPGSIATVLFPRISSIENTKANKLTPRVARHTFFITLIISLILAVFAKPLIGILFGDVFLPSVMPLLILLPGIIAFSYPKILCADLAGRGKPIYSLYASVISLGVNIPLNLWLIPRWGISGAAFATSVAYIIGALVVIAAFIKVSGESWGEILIIKKIDFQDYKNILYKIRKKVF